jgi:hypothetical protein
VDSSLAYKDVWRYYADGIWSEDHNTEWPGTSTNGVGQIFNVTNTFTVEKVRIWSARYYNTNDMYVTIYKDVDPVFGVPADYMVASNIVAQFTIDPGTTAPKTSSGLGDVFEIALTNSAEYFDLAPLADTNLSYYFHIDFEDVDYGTNIPWQVFLWSYSENYDSNGYAVTPDGAVLGTTSRDLGISFQSTNPPVIVLPDIPTNWVLAEADTTFRPIEKPTTSYGTSTTLDVRNHNDPTVRDYNAYVRFNLSDLAGKTITSARFEVSHAWGAYPDNGNRVQFYGLYNVESNTPQDWAESMTPADLGAEYIVTNTSSITNPFDVTNRVADLDGMTNPTNLIVETWTESNLVHSVTGDALVDFLNSRLADADTNGIIRATLILASRNDGGAWSLGYHSREVDGTTNQDKQPRLILTWEGGGPIGPQFDPTINSIAVSGGTVTINWESDVNGTYRIENKAALSDATWSPVSGATNLTGGVGKSTPVPASGGDAEFFRVYGE